MTFWSKLTVLVVAPNAVFLAGCARLVGADFGDKYLSKGQPPVAGNSSIVVVEGTQNNVATFNATDPEGNSLTYRLLNGAGIQTQTLATGAGSVTIEGDGTFRYASRDGTKATSDSFKYVVNDGAHDSAEPGTVNVKILPWRSKLKSSELPNIQNKYFGMDVALDGDTAAIGAPSSDEPGAVYIAKQQDDGSWRIQGDPIAMPAEAPPHSMFGWSVALSGDWLIVGNLGLVSGATSPPGQAFFYKRGSDGNFSLAQPAVSAGTELDLDRFGKDVAISGQLAAVGAEGDNVNGPVSGAVYTYRLDGDHWVLEQRVAPDPKQESEGTAWDLFGGQVSLDGDTLAVTAKGDDDGGTDAGAVYMYHHDESGWTLDVKRRPPGGALAGFFMSTVDVTGDLVVCGAPNAHAPDENTGGIGEAFIYTHDPEGGNHRSWTAGQTPLNDSKDYDEFGWGVAISADTAFVVRRGKSTVGAVLLYRKNEAGDWIAYAPSRSRYPIVSDTHQGDSFGWAIAVDGSRLAVSSLWELPNGTVTFFNLPPPGTD